MRILVTGGAGYIGSRLIPELLNNGHTVTVLDNFKYNQPSLSQCCMNRRFNLEFGNVMDTSLVTKLVSQADVIIPLAAIVGAPACDKKPVESEEVNVTSIKNMVKTLHRDQIIIFPSTNSIYGAGDISRPCDEESIPNPISLYSRQKLEAETVVLDHESSVCLRLATVFGLSERMRFDLLINDFVFSAVMRRKISIFEGNFKRNFLSVNDAARVFQSVIQRESKMFGNVYNFGLSNLNLSKVEICEMIKEFVPDLEIDENMNAADPDQRNYIVSNEKIESLGVFAIHNLRDGIYELTKGANMYVNGNYSNI